MIRRHTWVFLSAAMGLLHAGCSDSSAYCFNDCAASPDDSDAGLSDADIPPDVHLGDAQSDAPIFNFDSGPGEGGAPPALNDEECNGEDDDGDGEIDEDVDFTSPLHCGTCDTNCVAGEHLLNPTCTPPDDLDGTTPGECGYERCETDFYDLDPLTAGCEYYCQWNPTGENTSDPGGENGCGRDDDCDGDIDEDVDMCTVDNCGKCGRHCVTPNGTAKCVTTATDGNCTEDDTECAVDSCDEGWVDADGSGDNGCEYQCTETNGGVEICDGLDNDCDKLIDNADPSLETADPDVGTVCYGGEFGACASEDHAGIQKCVGGQIRCCDPASNELEQTNDKFPATGLRNALCDATDGPQVVHPGELDEECNGIDDDCDNTVDNNLIDVGEACGVSAAGRCTLGIRQCTDGAPVCVGNIDPLQEVCNGQDDDCDGVIDGTLASDGEPQDCDQDDECPTGQFCLGTGSGKVCALPAVDAGTECDVPLPVEGGVSACSSGVLRCTGGVKTCLGATLAIPGATDTCGVDRNCDGQLSNQPDLTSDPHNCGTCGNDCSGGLLFATWTCVDGQCVDPTACVPGRIDCDPSDGAFQCERSCTPTASGAEYCNGVDDDCDCLVDDDDPDLDVPTPVQVCGVSSSATDAGCTSGVVVSCVDDEWHCTFPAGYCDNDNYPNYCEGVPDGCDTRDNNCNGIPDERFVRPLATTNILGDKCTVGVGACANPDGTFTCTADGAGTECTGTTFAPGTETCNGLDDDCDGLVDESYEAPGTGTFVQPSVVQLDTSTWMFAYEASRAGASGTSSGSGNGYFTAAPVGETLDQTVACSKAGVLPWTNVSPWEVEQTCAAIGGRICRLADWQDVCRVNGNGTTNDCRFGYSPAGPSAACQDFANYSNGPYCNLGSFDFSSSHADGLLPTKSSRLNSCAAQVSTLFAGLDAFDVTGNAREINRCQRDRAICGRDAANDTEAAAICAYDCCSGVGTNVAGSYWICGDLGDSDDRRLSGQPCGSQDDRCCDHDDVCDANGICDTSQGSPGYCRNRGTTSSDLCRARGVECDDDGQCCGDDTCDDGYCGGEETLPYAIYPLLGGGFATINENGATCDFEFFKVSRDFKLFDTGFRCCFDVDPTQ